MGYYLALKIYETSSHTKAGRNPKCRSVHERHQCEGVRAAGLHVQDVLRKAKPRRQDRAQEQWLTEDRGREVWTGSRRADTARVDGH